MIPGLVDRIEDAIASGQRFVFIEDADAIAPDSRDLAWHRTTTNIIGPSSEPMRGLDSPMTAPIRLHTGGVRVVDLSKFIENGK